MSFLVPSSPLHCVPYNLLRQLLAYVGDDTYFQPTASNSSHQFSFMRSGCHSFSITNSSIRVHSTGTLHLGVNAGVFPQILHCLQPQISTNSVLDHINDGEQQVDSSSGLLESLGEEYYKETERRRKIGMANKGKTPWNKGRKHSEETREKIKQRTIEALRDPKVRKKMSERPGARILSKEIKAKIGASQKLVWRKRLELKRLREKFYMIWAESIAEAAKRGGCEQKELEWDSYKKLEVELALQQRKWAEDEVKAKEIAKLRAAREKAEKMARRSQKKQEEEEKKAKAMEVKRRLRRKLKEEKKEVHQFKVLKLKARVTKGRLKKFDGEVASRGDMATALEPAIEKLDLDFIKREKLRREVSLADQIRAAKNKRTESAGKEALTKPSPKFLMDERVGQLATFSKQQGHRMWDSTLTT